MAFVLKGSSNVYEQIVEHYKKYIELNIYQANERLPSCRVLAKELGINPNTVERAYSVLEEQGYIQTIPKKGVYVKGENNIQDLSLVKKQIIMIKESNVDYDTLISVIKEVYEND